MTFLNDGNESSRDWDKVEKPAAKKTYKAHDVLVIIDLQLSRFRRATINMYVCVSLGWYCLRMRGNLQHRDMDSWHGIYTTNGGWSSTMGIRIIAGGWSSAMNTGYCDISWVAVLDESSVGFLFVHLGQSMNFVQDDEWFQAMTTTLKTPQGFLGADSFTPHNGHENFLGKWFWLSPNNWLSHFPKIIEQHQFTHNVVIAMPQTINFWWFIPPIRMVMNGGWFMTLL